MWRLAEALTYIHTYIQDDYFSMLIFSTGFLLVFFCSENNGD